MTDFINDTLFSRHFMMLKILSAAYVVGLVLSHATLPEIQVWLIACFFSIAMNFTYPWAAWQQGQFLTVEVCLSCGLILLCVIGLFVSPLLIIASIFGHGIWDYAKHRGAGAPFFAWYVNGCAVVDWLYSGALLFYFFS